MDSAGAVAADRQGVGTAADVDASAVDQRDTVADPGGCTVAGRARAVRPWDRVYDLFPGRSRGGLTTKLHLAVEQGQKSLSLIVTAGHWHDSPQFQPVLEAIRVPRQGPGRPRTRPDTVRADKAYGSRASTEVRQGRLQGASCGGVRDQPAETSQICGHEVRQVGGPLRSDRAGRSDQRVAMARGRSTTYPPCTIRPSGVP